MLTRELLPRLREAAALPGRRQARVITVSSEAHRQVDGLDWDDLQSFEAAHSVVGYCRAKLANVLFTRELARRERAFGLVAQALHPAVGRDGPESRRAGRRRRPTAVGRERGPAAPTGSMRGTPTWCGSLTFKK
ncbi:MULTISPECIES: hypothetical protein [unclassified Streptomyces]|uniref:hypothetical protein n=1 Tax=unclassified Streptomyces TaxID=2593676 RepID=UPI00278C61AC|nr:MULTISPECIES: hypothetical protein [unclassified Streptomyces]